MAMTKKEKDEFEKLKMLLALRFTETVEKDLKKPNYNEDNISGWDFNTYSLIAIEEWSSSISHGSGKEKDTQWGGSQNGKDLFSTRLLALKAMRNEVEIQCARKLYSIDKMIENEMPTR
jgi:hypothetical protein